MTERDAALDDTIPTRGRAPTAARTGEADADADADPDADADADTIIRLIEPVTSAEVASRSVAPDARLVVIAHDTEQPPPPSAAVREWALRIRGTTAVVALDIPVIIGRRPVPGRIREAVPPRRLVIPPAFGEVSGRHVRVEQLGESLVVHDLGSTNGTVVHWATGVSRRLRRGESCAVLPDAVIVVADGVVIEFIARPAPTGT